MSVARKLDNWLKAYTEHTLISEAPPTFHFWTGVSVIAGALRRRVWIEQKLFQWTPNFYIILVGPPGVATKSTAMKVGYRMLRKVKGIHFGPQSMTWQGLLKAFKESKVGVKLYPLEDDALAERMFMSCITCDISELGTFLKPNDVEMTDFLIDMWDGQIGSWKRSLSVSEDTELENPWLNVIGCVTPSWLSNNFDSSMIFGGLTSRCIFIWGNQKTRLIPYPGDLIENNLYADREANLVHDLKEISDMFGEFRLTTPAKQLGSEWYEEHWTTRPDHLASDRYSGYLARKQTHIHKLAMVFSAAESNSREITKETLDLAIRTVTEVEHDMVKIFDSITDNVKIKHLDEIISIVERHKGITKGNLLKQCIRQMTEEDFKAAISAGVNAGYLKFRQTQNEILLLINERR